MEWFITLKSRMFNIIPLKKIYSLLKNIYKGTGLNKNIFIHKLINYYICGNIVDYISKKRKFILKKNDGLGLKLQYLLRWYEAETVSIFSDLLKPGMTVIDIGASTGYFTCLFSRLVGPKGRVYAFEPDPDNYDILIKNIELAGTTNVVSVKKAVSDYVGLSKFYKSDSSGLNSLLKNENTIKEIEVEVTTIDTFFKSERDDIIDFIKIDIEGAEPQAIKGMSKTVQRSKHLNMIVEHNPEALQGILVNLQEFSDIFKSLECSVKVIEEFQDGSSNLLCTKNL